MIFVSNSVSVDRTYSSSTSHRPQQAVVDLYDFLDSLTCDPVAGSSSRICSDDDPSLKTEGKRSGTVREFNGTVGIGMVVCCCSKEG